MENINNILIVEDEENIALALEAIIQRNIHNSSIQLASNGQQAWEILMEQTCDLILSDWNMPVKSGDELLFDVRQDKRTRHIPFLMLTARADRDSIITAIQAGVNDYIAKPFEKNDVINKIRKYLDKTS
jgi:DNA-binding response OmpR family regulator